MPKKPKPLRADFLSIFPEMFPGYLSSSILGRAEKAGLIETHVHDLRDWAFDKHARVDDRPFGGGPGMVMKVAPFHEALVSLRLRTKKGTPTAAAKKARVIVTSAKGKLFTEAEAQRLSKYDRLVFLCGRYEGIDERVIEHLADEEFCVGPYVLTGGELPAMTMFDAAARLRPGVLGKEASLDQESWNDGETRESPQYSQPAEYLGWKVPDVLLSGNHRLIQEWRKSKEA